MEGTPLRFAEAARCLARSARALGLHAPDFRSPPRRLGAVRTIRRRPDGGTTVAVLVRGRPFPAVLGDMIEGVVVANRLGGRAAHRARAQLWAAVESDVRLAA